MQKVCENIVWNTSYELRKMANVESAENLERAPAGFEIFANLIVMVRLDDLL